MSVASPTDAEVRCQPDPSGGWLVWRPGDRLAAHFTTRELAERHAAFRRRDG